MFTHVAQGTGLSLIIQEIILDYLSGPPVSTVSVRRRQERVREGGTMIEIVAGLLASGRRRGPGWWNAGCLRMPRKTREQILP